MAQQLKTALTILRRRQVETKLSLSRTAIYDRFNPKSPSYDPTFPKPIELGTGKNPPVGWIEADLDAWIMSKAVIAADKGPK
ncbi:MAG: AlpA family phage regulatory protein [Rhodocyclales bacterium GT-UBC]|nr:MAG: AlpA family phage regulatory protein [Rhodocyclales bacterium GT-UBC]